MKYTVIGVTRSGELYVDHVEAATPACARLKSFDTVPEGEDKLNRRYPTLTFPGWHEEAGA